MGRFRVLTTLFDYSGNEAIEQSCQETIGNSLPASWPFQGLEPVLQITRVEWSLWQLGQERTGVLLVLPEEQPEIVAEPQKPFVSSGLFTERDIISWERPLRVTEDSAWSVQGRRLRTLLMRLIAQGRVGRDGLPAEQLSAGLPQQHAEALQLVLPELIEAGVLVEEPSQGIGQVVCLNPELLLIMQDLINRDVSAIWETLVEDRNGKKI